MEQDTRANLDARNTLAVPLSCHALDTGSIDKTHTSISSKGAYTGLHTTGLALRGGSYLGETAQIAPLLCVRLTPSLLHRSQPLYFFLLHHTVSSSFISLQGDRHEDGDPKQRENHRRVPKKGETTTKLQEQSKTKDMIT